MHFRIRKNVIQLIRTHYDPSTKKGKNTIIGKVSLANPQIDDTLRQQLSPEELAAFNAWLSIIHRAAILEEELAALSLTETLAKARRWFTREGSSGAASVAVMGLVAEWQSLRKVLQQHGLLG